MLAGRYDFAESRGRIGGWRDTSGAYYGNDGSHRMAAALEICRQSDNPEFVRKLLQYGV